MSKLQFLSLIILLHPTVSLWAQCPADTPNLVLTGNITITSGDSPCVVNIDEVISDANIVIEDGASIEFVFSGAGFTDAFDQSGGSITLQSDVMGGNGGIITITNGNFYIENASLNIELESVFDVSGDFQLGLPGSGDPTSLTMDGDVNVGNDIVLNDNSSISGEGTLTVVGDMTNNSTDDSGFTGTVSCGGSSCVTLPVDLVSFNAISNAFEMRLYWTTASEINNEGFEIEKSDDGQEFEYIGFKTGNGTTNQTHNYFFSDYEMTNSHVYYRLKQIDYDGTYVYSDIIEVYNETQVKLVSLYPSSVIDKLYFNSNSELEYQMYVFNLSGAFTFGVSKPTDLRSLERLINQEIPTLSPSVYIINLVTRNEKISLRFVKQ